LQCILPDFRLVVVLFSIFDIRCCCFAFASTAAALAIISNLATGTYLYQYLEQAYRAVGVAVAVDSVTSADK
jgi:hypothetical protein